MKKWFWPIFAAVFFLSRLPFINSQAVFFDSGEYLQRFADVNYFHALTNGHVPLHAGYIFLFWPIAQLALLLHQNVGYWVIVGQIIFACLTLRFFYDLLLFLFDDRKLAMVSTVFAAIIPLYWITNSTIMMETTYVGFFFLAAWAIIKYVQQTKILSWWLLVFATSFVLSYLTHPFVIFWMPFLLTIVIQKNGQRGKVVITIFILLFIIASFINAELIAFGEHTSFFAGLQNLYGSKLSEQSSFSFSLHGIFVYLRNAFLPLARNNTSIVLFFAVVGLLFLYRKDKNNFLVFLLWILPALFVNQWWDSLLYGRHALLTGFGLATLTAYVTYRQKMLFLLTFLCVLATSLYALSLLRKPIPYVEEAQTIEQLPSNGLLIESHFARPQTQDIYKGQTIFVDEPFWNQQALPSKIHASLELKQPVFVSSAALSEPYGLYSGPYLHILSLSYAQPFRLTNTLKNFTLKPYKIVDQQDNLIMYEITSEQPGAYPIVPHLQTSLRRIDFLDPFTQLQLSLASSPLLNMLWKKASN